jgi:hypothetical protein
VGVLNISQPNGPPRSVTGIALLFICRRCSYLTGDTHTTGNSFTFLYADDVRTSQETHILVGIALPFYIQMMFLPQKKHMACYGNSFTFLYADDVSASKETHGLLRRWLYFLIYRRCSHLKGNTRPVTEITLLFYMQVMFVSQRKQLGTGKTSISYI